MLRLVYGARPDRLEKTHRTGVVLGKDVCFGCEWQPRMRPLHDGWCARCCLGAGPCFTCQPPVTTPADAA